MTVLQQHSFCKPGKSRSVYMKHSCRDIQREPRSKPSLFPFPSPALPCAAEALCKRCPLTSQSRPPRAVELLDTGGYRASNTRDECIKRCCNSVRSLSKPAREAAKRCRSFVRAASKRCPSVSKQEPNAVQAQSKPPTFLSKRLSYISKTPTFRVQDSVPSTLIILLKGEEWLEGVV